MNESKHAGFVGVRFYLGVGFLYAAHNLWTTLLLWQVLVLTNSGTFVSVAVALASIPTIVIGLTGPNFGPSSRMSWWLGGFSMILLGSSISLLHAPLGLLGLAVVEGWVNARVLPLSQAWLMTKVPRDNIAQASSRFEIASRTGIVVGPLLAGLLLTRFHATAAILSAAFFFLLSALCWWHVRNDGRDSRSLQILRQRDAWNAIRSDAFLKTALSVRSVSNWLWPAFTVTIPLLTAVPWHAHALGYGAIRAVWGIGTVLGTVIIVPYLLKQLQVSYFLSWSLTGLAFFAIGLSVHLESAIMWVIIGSLTAPVVHIALDTHIGTHVDPRQQPSVFAIQRLMMAVATLIGLIFVATVLKETTPGDTLSGAGVLMAVASMIGWITWRRQPRFNNTVAQDP